MRQQPLHIRSSTAGSAIQPGTQISRFDQWFGISQKFHLVTLLFLLFENVLKQTGGQRTPAFELLQVSKVCVEDNLLVQDVGPVWTIAVGFRHHKHLRDNSGHCLLDTESVPMDSTLAEITRSYVPSHAFTELEANLIAALQRHDGVQQFSRLKVDDTQL